MFYQVNLQEVITMGIFSNFFKFKHRTGTYKKRTKKEELQSLRASLKAQYLKNMGGSPYHKDATKVKKNTEIAERLMTPRSKVF